MSATTATHAPLPPAALLAQVRSLIQSNPEAAEVREMRRLLTPARKPKRVGAPPELPAEPPPGALLVAPVAELLAAARHAAMGCDPKSKSPVLATMLLRTEEDGTATLTGTDMEMACICPVAGVTWREQASLTLTAAPVLAFLAGLPVSALVTIRPDEKGVKLAAPGRVAVVESWPAEDFPTIDPVWPVENGVPLDAEPLRFQMAAGALLELLNRTHACISTEETRYYLNGVCLHRPEGGDTLRAATCDGHRLALFDVPAPAGSDALPETIVPTPAVNALRKMLAGVPGATLLNLARSPLGTRLQVEAPGVGTVLTKLIDGKFPDYTKVTPAENERVPLLHVSDPAAFAALVKPLVKHIGKGSGPVRLTVTPDGATRLAARNQDGGEAEALCAPDVARWRRPLPEGMVIGYQGRFLIDFAASFHEGFSMQVGQEVPSKVEGEAPTVHYDGPALLLPTAGGRGVVMPMRV